MRWCSNYVPMTPYAHEKILSEKANIPKSVLALLNSIADQSMTIDQQFAEKLAAGQWSYYYQKNPESLKRPLSDEDNSLIRLLFEDVLQALMVIGKTPRDVSSLLDQHQLRVVGLAHARSDTHEQHE